MPRPRCNPANEMDEPQMFECPKTGAGPGAIFESDAGSISR
jgi:hypothetical protein